MILDNINAILSRVANVETHSKFHNISNYEDLKVLFETRFNSALNRYKSGYKIWRGMREYSRLFMVTPGKRISQNTSNLYTTLFSDILPQWKDYPKRNSSFICSSSYLGSLGYGCEVYLVLPENNAKIGVCPMGDIWASFDDVSALPYLNSALDRILALAHEKYNIPYNTESVFNKQDNVNAVLHAFELADKYIKEINYDYLNDIFRFEQCGHIILECKSKDISLLKNLENKLDPDTNGFSLTNIENYDVSEKTKELWTDATCIFMFEPFLVNFLENNPI